MAHILDTIVSRKKEEVAVLKRNGVQVPEPFADKHISPPRGFRDALINYPEVAIIAEAKKASPSKGLICPDFDPVQIAIDYEKNGAQAISVLTDVDFFQGSLLYLLQARESVNLPILRKEFIIDPLQIEEAHICGADAILLMASILDLFQLKDFMDQAKEYSIDCLVEVHDEEELETVLETNANLIGINNRNLKDFSMDTETTFRLKKMIPSDIAVVGESGLKTAEDIKKLGNAGVCAALIGETLMRGRNGGNSLQGLRAIEETR
jgi:indole-3-glycerol phosphate synthase